VLEVAVADKMSSRPTPKDGCDTSVSAAMFERMSTENPYVMPCGE